MRHRGENFWQTMGTTPCFGDGAHWVSGGYDDCGLLQQAVGFREKVLVTPPTLTQCCCPPLSSNREKCVSFKLAAPSPSVFFFNLFLQLVVYFFLTLLLVTEGSQTSGLGQERTHIHTVRRLHVTSPHQTITVS